VRVGWNKVMVFAISGAIAGVGGAMLGLFSFNFSNSTAPPTTGLFWLSIAVLAGIRRPGGALLAGLFFAGGTAVFHWLSSYTGGDVNAMITSVYFVPILTGLGAIQVAQNPDGILTLPSLYEQIRMSATHRNRKKEMEIERLARIQAAEAQAHGGVLPEHEQLHEEAPMGGAAAVIDSTPPENVTFAVRDLVAGYGDVEVLHGVSLSLDSGKVTALLGANGAGKSTLCLVAAGAVDATAGAVYLEGAEITKNAPFQRARDGVLLVPEARGIFPGLTVEENLTVLLRNDEARDKAYTRFPILRERRKQPAGLLSGGEQQMLSLAPALAEPPKVLIADEPTLGLSPLAADAVMNAILELRDRGSAVLLVEEHAQNALKVADTMAFMELGNIVWSGAREDASMEMLTSAYLGSH
jgi:ABC-type branched-subunit amino acid transport system ATPase component